MSKAKNTTDAGESKAIDWSAIGVIFYTATGKQPLDAVDEFKVFGRVVTATVNPTPKNKAWISLALQRHKPTPGLLWALILAALEKNNPSSVGAIRQMLTGFATEFGDTSRLTNGQIEKAMERRTWNARLADMALRAGALGATKRDNESRDDAIKRIGHAGHTAKKRAR